MSTTSTTSTSSRAFVLTTKALSAPPLFMRNNNHNKHQLQLHDGDDHPPQNNNSNNKLKQWLQRFDTLEAAGLNEEYKENPPLAQRGGGKGGLKKWVGIFSLLMLYRWYRTKFINKIPFWDKQPQWNMVVTTKEQEDELRAYTCKNCGTTLFIARNREWFFEGPTGLSGLGCYSCGAKGKDNFVMDRDRIVDEVGDDDDYFSFERPLDFVTLAERKALMKEAGGDEELANSMLQERTVEADKDAPEKPEMFASTAAEQEAEAAEAEAVAAEDNKDSEGDDGGDKGEDTPAAAAAAAASNDEEEEEEEAPAPVVEKKETPPPPPAAKDDAEEVDLDDLLG